MTFWYFCGYKFVILLIPYFQKEQQNTKGFVTQLFWAAPELLTHHLRHLDCLHIKT